MGRIALMGGNSISFVKELIDIWNSGNCAVLIDCKTPIRVAISMMADAEVTECRIEKRLFDSMENIETRDIKWVVFESGHDAELLPPDVYESFRSNYTSEEALIIYSSGTTGAAKGIILSHYAVNTNADAIISYMRPTSEDTIYIVKSLAHSSTITGELLVALKSKMRVLVAPTMVPPRCVFSNLEKYDITILCVNPTLLSMYVDERKRHRYELSTLRVIYVSGSILNDQIYKLAKETFTDIAIYNVYGLSEAGPRVAAQRGECCKSNSVGKPIMSVEIAVVDSGGKLVPPGTRGIIHVNTPCRMNGYVTGKGKHSSLYKNWLNTGDVGYINEVDELVVVDRLDDLMVINSHKIYPGDVERAIINNTDIRECAVVKIEWNNDEFIGCLYTGECCDVRKTRKELQMYLLPYEIPRIFVRGNMIPKTNNGKVAKLKVSNIIKEEVRRS